MFVYIIIRLGKYQTRVKQDFFFTIVYIDSNIDSREAELLNQMSFACFAAETQQACCTRSVICNLVDLQWIACSAGLPPENGSSYSSEA